MNAFANPDVHKFDERARASSVANVLGGAAGSLYAVVDSARGPQVRAWLAECGLSPRCLYQGQSEIVMSEYAPYLVELPRGRSDLESFVRRSWGDSWCIYLSSSAGLDEVRGHLRRYTIVMHPSGKPVYFRFYDPRVLRVFLPTCLSPESATFFGPISRFYMEGKDVDVLIEAMHSRGGPICEFRRLAGESRNAATAR